MSVYRIVHPLIAEVSAARQASHDAENHSLSLAVSAPWHVLHAKEAKQVKQYASGQPSKIHEGPLPKGHGSHIRPGSMGQ